MSMRTLTQSAGTLSALALAASTLAPIVSIPTMGSFSSFGVSPLLTVLLICMAIAGCIFAIRNNGNGVLMIGLASLVIAGLVFFRTMVKIGAAESEVRSKFETLAQAGGMDPKGLPIDTLMSETRLGWGWILMVASLVGLLLIGILMRRASIAR